MVRTSIKMIRNLCISGAGTQGPALLGALIELKRQGKLKDVRDMCGVSFGSFLIVLLSLGWDPTELYEETKNINVADMFKPNVRQFFDNFGMASSDMLISYVDKLIERKGYDKNLTFRDHLYHTDIMIRIPAVCLNTRRMVYFSHLNYPDLPIRDAVRASMSIPLLYTSPKIDDQHYVDGGILRNLPYDPYIGHEKQTLCISIKSNPHQTEPISNIQQYITALLGSIKSLAEHIPPEFIHSIEIVTKYSGTNFSIEQGDIEDMVNIGIQYCVI